MEPWLKSWESFYTTDDIFPKKAPGKLTHHTWLSEHILSKAAEALSLSKRMKIRCLHWKAGKKGWVISLTCIFPQSPCFSCRTTLKPIKRKGWLSLTWLWLEWESGLPSHLDLPFDCSTRRHWNTSRMLTLPHLFTICCQVAELHHMVTFFFYHCCSSMM